MSQVRTQHGNTECPSKAEYRVNITTSQKSPANGCSRTRGNKTEFSGTMHTGKLNSKQRILLNNKVTSRKSTSLRLQAVRFLGIFCHQPQCFPIVVVLCRAIRTISHSRESLFFLSAAPVSEPHTCICFFFFFYFFFFYHTSRRS